MRCVIPKAHLKIFARAVHSLAKIGDDLYLDAGEGGLAISTINSSRSAYATYSFRAAFFSSYEPPAEDVNTTDANEDDDDDESAGERSKCKVAMKGAVWVFKSISHLEKTVDSAELTLAPLESKLRARMNCRFSVSKTYSLPFLECEPLKANCDASHSKNGFTAQSKVLSEAALNFLSNQEEVTLLAESDAFVIKNYIDVYDVRNADKEQPTPTGGIKGAPVHTKLSMNPETDFSRYEIDPADEEQSKAGLTFCLKEFRSILAFADALNLPISASFDSGGLPIIFSLNCPQSFEASLVMATMSDGSCENNNQTARDLDESAVGENSTRRRRTSAAADAEAARERLSRPPSSGEFAKNSTLSTSQRGMQPPPPPSSATPIPFPTTADLIGDVGNGGDVSSLDVTSQPPQPPPNKKRRVNAFFQRCFDATFNPNDATAAHRILAPDSDEE